MPDVCPHCGGEVVGPCICPVGFGAVRDPNCPKHGNRRPAHTITGAVERASDLPDLAAGIGSAPAESLEGCAVTTGRSAYGEVYVRLTHPGGRARTGHGATEAEALAQAQLRMALALQRTPRESFFAEPLPRSRRFRVEPGRDRSA